MPIPAPSPAPTSKPTPSTPAPTRKPTAAPVQSIDWNYYTTSASVSDIPTFYDNAVSGTYVEFNDDDGNCAGTSYESCTTSSHSSCSVSSSVALSSGIMTATLSGTVSSSTSGCCTANTCASVYMETESGYFTAGQTIYYTYYATGGGDWYECAASLYSGQTTSGTYATTTSSSPTETAIYRGDQISNYKTDSFTVPSDGYYYLVFYTGSYDRTGGTVLGANMYISGFTFA